MPTADPPAGVHISYTRQFRRCGKSDCPTCRAGKRGHGPYWYAYWRESGRVRTRYIGRQTPDLMAPAPGELHETAPLAFDAHSALRTRTLGAFQVWRGTERISAELWTRRDATTLFKALLSVPGHRLHREQASEMLWPNADPASHAVSLRGAVYRLRKALDGSGDSHILVRNGWLTLAPLPGGEPPPDWLDADWFELSARRALDGQEIVACRKALLCYGGDYLPDDLYEEWAVRRREELRQLRLAVLMHLADLSTAHGDMSGARRALQAVLDADACHEMAVRALMRLYALGGQRAEAIRLYRRFAAALESELARLLTPLRQYAAEQLAASGEAEVIRRRHWTWYKDRHDTP